MNNNLYIIEYLKELYLNIENLLKENEIKKSSKEMNEINFKNIIENDIKKLSNSIIDKITRCNFTLKK